MRTMRSEISPITLGLPGAFRLELKSHFLAMSRRYQDTPICWLGDVGDSMYKTVDYLIETMHDMVAMGMDISKENFSTWPEIIHTDWFLDELVHRLPGIFNKVAPLIKEKRR